MGQMQPRGCSIRLNTDLAKKPPKCLEYIVVHEMVHLLESTHNGRFVAIMDRSHAAMALLSGAAKPIASAP